MGNKKPRLINIDKEREGVGGSPAPSHSLLRRCEAVPGPQLPGISIRVADGETKKDIGNASRETSPKKETCLRSPDN